MNKKSWSRYAIVFATIWTTSACTDANFSCDSDPVRERVLEASQDRFAAKLVIEYAEENTADTRDPYERARADASNIEIASTRQIRKNYLEKELLCVATVHTPRDASVSVSYVIQKVDSKVNVALR
ncbi:hypothetical protein FM042_03295 [Aliidiomarina halalkaliphila]|uniref:Uncharacterized protein n=1 Tax=Aliidiomarina halalkaliphila TaxID=2593535 RepID=A0A552X4C9_9GAMM|nr:hypothetical protein [Aliidiomarina halalkaliphila]TRW49891.1 hypothetical protein FM042_03295 [Aliidiomarina halalkaliphila]